MEFKPCSTGFFKIIDGVWGKLAPKHTMHRVCTIMRTMQAKTVVIEPLRSGTAEWKRFNQEEVAISRRLKQDAKSINALKYTFLQKEVPDATALMALKKAAEGGDNSAFLGYAIIANVDVPRGTWSYIFESVVPQLGVLDSAGTLRPLQNHYLHVKRRFSCEVGGVPYSIDGAYFRQQNGITNVCAHACTVTMLNNASLPNGIVTAEDINGLLKFDQEVRKFRINQNCVQSSENLPAGLGISDLEKVL